jgi:biopolymer transport protein TolQ
MHAMTMAAAAGSNMDLGQLLGRASGIVLGVLCILGLLSLVSWYIIFNKFFSLWRAQREGERFLEAFWRAKRIDEIYQTAQAMPHTPLSQLFVAGYTELSKLLPSENPGASDPYRPQAAGGAMRDSLGDLEAIERALSRAHVRAVTQMENLVPFLATTGSAGPFIGLFGTVWGIMNSFRAIASQKSASLVYVAPGMAEALIATAIGLIAAIPAVMAYNYFVRRIRVLSNDMESFEKDFLNIVRRHFLK